ncbi:MAG TPA: 2-oxo-4-hydroxy-4-carboxy-5-ureidoimidazoline decarboxylase [Polyangiaceae bacterium]|nr:2-oxo-4-hydroxy-4-carboxy-5-ureidoimidazoline decarboxylase [Polyangiaceae bacterium]
MSEVTLTAPLIELNRCAVADAERELLRCCGSTRWAQNVAAQRPFSSLAALHEAAQRCWCEASETDCREAFSHHPQIGANLEELRKKFAPTASLSAAEQAGAAHASETTLFELRELNLRYLERYGYIFIICASGRSAEQMLEALRARLDNEPDRELVLAAAEQGKIMHLRLEKLFG